MMYCHKISDSDQLKCVLIDCWTQLSLDILNQVINQLPKRLTMVIKSKGAYVEFCLNKFCEQIIVAVTFTVCLS